MLKSSSKSNIFTQTALNNEEIYYLTQLQEQKESK